MNRKPLQSNEPWENDAVWKLLEQAPPAEASGRFADDTVRAARLLGQSQAWWKRVFAPLPLAGLAGATAALVFSISGIVGPGGQPTAGPVVESPYAEQIQEIAATETLMAAVENLDNFSDRELVTLIGF